jgi:hypothetical protein
MLGIVWHRVHESFTRYSLKDIPIHLSTHSFEQDLDAVVLSVHTPYTYLNSNFLRSASLYKLCPRQVLDFNFYSDDLLNH